MNVAVFSYFFAGFQYSITPVHEAAPVALLVVTTYPLWFNLGNDQFTYSYREWWGSELKGSVVAAIEALVMVWLAIMWVAHSAMYRTIGYRAAWIQAWNLQSRSETPNRNPNIKGKKPMSSLWILGLEKGTQLGALMWVRAFGLLLLFCMGHTSNIPQAMKFVTMTLYCSS